MADYATWIAKPEPGADDSRRWLISPEVLDQDIDRPCCTTCLVLTTWPRSRFRLSAREFPSLPSSSPRLSRCRPRHAVGMAVALLEEGSELGDFGKIGKA